MNYPELDSIEIESLKKQIKELQLQIGKYKALLQENEIDLEEEPLKNTVELICEVEILKLQELSNKGGLTMEDTKILDILHKNLLLARGELKTEKKDSKKGAKSVAELLSIVSGAKKNG
jgi:hypothetical protein